MLRVASPKHFVGLLREGPFTSVGCYPIFYVTADGGVLSWKAARENALRIGRAIRDENDRQWRVEALDINWEDPCLMCDESGERIESAYAEEGEH